MVEVAIVVLLTAIQSKMVKFTAKYVWMSETTEHLRNSLPELQIKI
jgi:hypothetical protein